MFQHLQGAYAGLDVCPMCRHGYDAGLLVLLPSTTAPENARRIAHALRAAATGIGSERFRAFLILAGATPSPALLDAVAGPETNWYVAHLPAARVAAAARDFALPPGPLAQGYVFAQRRLLWRFDPLTTDWPREIGEQSRYAADFLRMTYADAAANTIHAPDAPQGRLWMAPNRLSSSIALSRASTTAASRVCFSDARHGARGDALVLLTAMDAAARPRLAFARSDDAGCVEIHGAPKRPGLRAEVFSPGLAPAVADIVPSSLRPDRTLAVRLESTPAGAREPVVGLPCEGCEAVFDGLPAQPQSSARIAPASEPGEPLVLHGIVRDRQGRPQSGVVIYAYHTDRGGIYPADPHLIGDAARHGRLRGWARTDAAGRYAFQTIRPGGYPGKSIPQHVHLHVIEPGRCTYYIGDVLFADDPRLTAELRAQAGHARGGSGLVEPRRDDRGVWQAQRDIVLGLGVPGHAACSAALPSPT